MRNVLRISLKIIWVMFLDMLNSFLCNDYFTRLDVRRNDTKYIGVDLSNDIHVVFHHPPCFLIPLYQRFPVSQGIFFLNSRFLS